MEQLAQWQRRHRRVLPCAGALALLFAAALNLWKDSANVIQYTPVLALAVFVCLVYGLPKAPRRARVVFGALGLVCAFFLTADPLVYTAGGPPRPWGAAAAGALVFFWGIFAVCGCGLSRLLGQAGRWLAKAGTAPDGATAPLDAVAVPTGEGASPAPAAAFGHGAAALPSEAPACEGKPAARRRWLCYGGVLLAAWLPAILAYGPLRLSADSFNVVQQALGAYPLQDNHPVLYTLAVRLFLVVGQALGSPLAGAWLLAAAQAIFVAGALAAGLCWLRENGCPRLLVWAAVGYYTLTPVFAINAITLWKDIPFNAVLLLWCLQLYAVARSRGAVLHTARGAAGFLAVGLAACFLRGNGFWLVAASLLGVALAFRGQWRRWLCLFVPFLLAVQLVLGPLYGALGLSRLGRVESASLPLQQVARAVQNGAPLTPWQTQVIERFIPLETLKTAYVSASPDHIKTHPEFSSQGFDEAFGDLMRVWGQLLPTNKQVYLDAWLLTTLGYWKVDFHGWTALVSEYEQITGLEGTDLICAATGWDARGFFAARTGFFTLALMAYVVLFCAAHLLAAGRGRVLLAYLPLLVLWAGLMLGAPTYCEFRYMLVFAYGLPVFVWLALCQGRAGPDAPAGQSAGPAGKKATGANKKPPPGAAADAAGMA